MPGRLFEKFLQQAASFGAVQIRTKIVIQPTHALVCSIRIGTICFITAKYIGLVEIRKAPGFGPGKSCLSHQAPIRQSAIVRTSRLAGPWKTRSKVNRVLTQNSPSFLACSSPSSEMRS